jgi:hypothetical protein
MLDNSEKSADGEAQSTPFQPLNERSGHTSVAAYEDFNYDQNDDGEMETDSAEDTARYIADMIASLAYIAREARLDLLTYLLDMARIEAEMQARQSETSLDD